MGLLFLSLGKTQPRVLSVNFPLRVVDFWIEVNKLNKK